MRRIVVISDLQIPYEDRRALKNLLTFIREYQPDAIVQIGDLMDYPAPSRWTSGTRAEFEGGVIRDSEYAQRTFLAPLRAVYDGPVDVLEGNHDERPRKYLAQRAPALSAEDSHYTFESLLNFTQWEIRKARPYFPIARGWAACHGHESPGLNTVAGRTAASRARRAGLSVVMGHTHRLAVSPETTGLASRKLHTLYGFEVGHLCSPRRMGYLKGGPANWQRGFGILYETSRETIPMAIPVDDRGCFVVEGQEYGTTPPATTREAA